MRRQASHKGAPPIGAATVQQEWTGDELPTALLIAPHARPPDAAGDPAAERRQPQQVGAGRDVADGGRTVDHSDPRAGARVEPDEPLSLIHI